MSPRVGNGPPETAGSWHRPRRVERFAPARNAALGRITPPRTRGMVRFAPVSPGPFTGFVKPKKRPNERNSINHRGFRFFFGKSGWCSDAGMPLASSDSDGTADVANPSAVWMRGERSC